MKGLEEIIEEEEKNKLFLKKIVLHISAIVISSSFLVKDILDYVSGEENKYEENDKKEHSE